MPQAAAWNRDRLALPAARKIYGQAMERIPSIGWFADAVSRLLCRQLRQG